jgi:hypothetical protein
VTPRFPSKLILIVVAVVSLNRAVRADAFSGDANARSPCHNPHLSQTVFFLLGSGIGASGWMKTEQDGHGERGLTAPRYMLTCAGISWEI